MLLKSVVGAKQRFAAKGLTVSSKQVIQVATDASHAGLEASL